MITVYPSKVVPNKIGLSLVATRNIHSDTIVQKFTGKEIENYDSLSQSDKKYVLAYFDKDSKKDKWLLPTSDVKYANHSCSPNCFINDNFELVTFKEVQEGEELTFIYNKGDPIVDEWDPTWTFDCTCGSLNCQKTINGYKRIDKFGNSL